MTDLTAAGLIDAAGTDAAEYFSALLQTGVSRCLLTDADAVRLRRESMTLLGAQTALYTGGESSSVRIETAEALLVSVFYTVGIALKSFASPDAALETLRTGSLAELFAMGQDLLCKKVNAARARHRKLVGNLFSTGNVFYRLSAADGIRGFFRLYRPMLLAQETHITADYPTLVPIGGLRGIEFVERYLAYIGEENRFLRCFLPETVHLYLCALPQDYRMTPMNLCLPVLTAALCCELTGQPPRGLACDREGLAGLLQGKGDAQIARLCYGALAPLCAALGTLPAVRGYLRRGIPQIAATLGHALRSGTLHAAVPLPARVEPSALSITDGERMDDRSYRALLVSLAACCDAGEKVHMLVSRVRSIGDLLDLLQDAELDFAELTALLHALPPAAVCALYAAYPVADLSRDARETPVYTALADYRRSLAPADAAKLDAAVRALSRTDAEV